MAQGHVPVRKGVHLAHVPAAPHVPSGLCGVRARGHSKGSPRGRSLRPGCDEATPCDVAAPGALAHQAAKVPTQTFTPDSAGRASTCYIPKDGPFP